jgi:protein gp37
MRRIGLGVILAVSLLAEPLAAEGQSSGRIPRGGFRELGYEEPAGLTTVLCCSIVGDQSGIEWTDATWNPVTGCTKISPGCKHCYAERLAERLQAMGNPRYRNGFKMTLHPDQLTLPLRWRDPRRIFVNSMSDLFHEDVPEEFIRRAFEIMTQAHWHIFQVLTKRARRLAGLAPRLTWPPNVWQGVSVENARYTARVADLVKVPAAVRFLSPLSSMFAYARYRAEYVASRRST